MGRILLFPTGLALKCILTHDISWTSPVPGHLVGQHNLSVELSHN
jgi:hypothetical protein